MVDEVSLARFRKADYAHETRPVDALRAAIAMIEAGELDPDHVMIVMGTNIEGFSGRVRRVEGGSYPYFGRVGLAAELLWQVQNPDN